MLKNKRRLPRLSRGKEKPPESGRGFQSILKAKDKTGGWRKIPNAVFFELPAHYFEVTFYCSTATYSGIIKT